MKLSYLPVLIDGFITTAELTVFATIIATALSVAAGVGLTSQTRPLRSLCRVYVEIFRGTSLLVQLFWIYYVLPCFDVSIDPFVAGIGAIALNNGAYGAEAVRGAINALPRGQEEAAKSLGLPRRLILFRILVPQACIFLLPQWGNFLIETMKTTAIVSVISINDLTFAGYQLNIRTYDTLTIYGLLLLIYFGLSQLIVVPVRLIERHYRLRTA